MATTPVTANRLLAAAEVNEADGQAVEHFGLLLIPGFSLMTFASFIEPLRQVNRLLGKEVYRWHLLSSDGGTVDASSGVTVMVDGVLQHSPPMDYLFVCAGIGVQQFDDEVTFKSLRRLSKQGVTIGALSTATFVLARAGLLDGYKCTVHWESLAALQEQYPAIRISSNLYVFDRKRITCAGATAGIDLMLHLIGNRFGYPMITAVSEQYNLSLIRRSIDEQRMPTGVMGQFNHPKIMAALFPDGKQYG